MELIKVKCKCGQTTHIERDGDVCRFAADPHGSNAICKGCFNCHCKIALPAVEKPVAQKPVVPQKTRTKKTKK